MTKVDDKFVRDNTGLVHSLAARFRGKGVEYEELFSAGCEGLVKAAHGFDESRGLKFSTYAVPVILGEIKRLFRDGGSVKVSRSLKELSLKAARVCEQLRRQGDEEPKLSEIANALGVSLEQAGEAVCASCAPVSLTSAEGDAEFDLPVPPEQAKLTEHIALEQCLELLESEDRLLIRLRYWENKTQSETGAVMGLSQVQVSRREKKILAMLREMMTA